MIYKLYIYDFIGFTINPTSEPLTDNFSNLLIDIILKILILLKSYMCKTIEMFDLYNLAQRGDKFLYRKQHTLVSIRSV